MARERSGWVGRRKDRKGIWARITYIDENGETKRSWRRVDNKTAGRNLNKKRLHDVDEHGPKVIEGDRVDFEHLARIYEKNELVPAKYRDGRKVEGLRSLSPAKSQLKKTIEYFGQRKIKSITPNDLKKFKAWLLDNDKY
jgi:hypothetical protein